MVFSGKQALAAVLIVAVGFCPASMPCPPGGAGLMGYRQCLMAA